MVILLIFPSSLRRGAAEGGGVVMRRTSNHPGASRPPSLSKEGKPVCLPRRFPPFAYRPVFRSRGIAPAASVLPSAALRSRRLEADDVVENALAARHLRIGQAAVRALQFPEARHALQHRLARNAPARQGFPMVHGGLPKNNAA